MTLLGGKSNRESRLVDFSVISITHPFCFSLVIETKTVKRLTFHFTPFGRTVEDDDGRTHKDRL